MPVYVETVNHILAFGTIGLQLVALLILISLIFNRSKDNTVLRFFNRYSFYLGFLVALSSVLLSLFYSEIAGFAACELCWVQRFFIYPQMIVFGLIIWWKEKKHLINISGILAFLGMFVSIYHVYVENGGSSNLACSTYQAGSITCAARYVYEFGYITVPVMALTAQAFILLLILNHKYMART